MTQEQAKAAVIALTDKKPQQFPIAKNSLAFKTALAAIEYPGEYQTCGQGTGIGRFSSSKSWQKQTAMIFQRAGIKFELHNDSPRGGKSGEKIKVLL